jgi:spore coat protein U-like protein
MKTIIRAMLIMAMFGVAANSYAATDTETLSPSLDVTAACTVNATGVNATFGKLGLGTGASSTMVGGSLVVTCPSAFAVGANIGAHGSANTRYLYLDASNKIAYTLSLAAVAWGDAGLNAIDPAYTDTMTTAAKAADGTASPYTYAITGTTSALGAQIVGSYTDTVTVTVAY